MTQGGEGRPGAWKPRGMILSGDGVGSWALLFPRNRQRAAFLHELAICARGDAVGFAEGARKGVERFEAAAFADLGDVQVGFLEELRGFGEPAFTHVFSETHAEPVAEHRAQMAHAVAEFFGDVGDGDGPAEIGPHIFVDALEDDVADVVAGMDVAAVGGQIWALAQVQQEQDLDASGRVNAETAAGKGKLMGAQMLITGDITAFTYNHSAIGGKLTNIVKGLDAGVERVSASVSIDLRLIDAETGEVIASIKGDGSAAQQGVTGHLTRDEKKYDGSMAQSTPLGKASRQAIDKSIAGIIDNLPKLAWSARVIDFRDGVVYLNAGSTNGMTKGMALEVFDPQPTLIDPETGRNLGSPEKLVGEVVIETVEQQYSTASVVKGSGFKRNQVLRFKEQGGQP